MECPRAAEAGSPGIQRSRRSLIKFGGIAGSLAIASLTPTSADVLACSTAIAARCFLRGTSILAAQGNRKVEDIRVGDLPPTVLGGERAVQWIGRARFKRNLAEPWAKDVLPVLIAPSALGPDVPRTELFVTRGHSILLDDLLAPISTLINETTIALDETSTLDVLEYLHIKLEQHEAIWAEGVPCETLREGSETFTNFSEYVRTVGHLRKNGARHGLVAVRV